MNSSVKAFTIIEVTVAMLLAGISILIALTAYQLVSRSYFRFDEKNQAMSEFLVVDRLLKKDIHEAFKIINTGEGIALETQRGTVSYEFEHAYILRNQYGIRKDTFFIRTNAWSTMFENETVIITELADEIIIETEMMKRSSILHYKKSYSIHELMNVLSE